MTNRELDKLLEKLDNIRRATPLTSEDIDLIVERIKEGPKKDQQTGPAIGQRYWLARIGFPGLYEYTADDLDSDMIKFRNIYPEERFAEAELRANKLIIGVNKRRREMNEGKEFGDRKYYIVCASNSRLRAWDTSISSCVRGYAYPFGLFKDPVDCETCIREFKDELKWFYEDYLLLMEELDNYDWAEQPGWGECNAKKGCKA